MIGDEEGGEGEREGEKELGVSLDIKLVHDLSATSWIREPTLAEAACPLPTESKDSKK